MTDKTVDYAWLMSEGNESLNRGAFAEAARTFTLATDRANSMNEVASAFQMQGIALRLDKKYEEAHVAFCIAKRYARTNEELRLRIDRDEAAVYMGEGKLQQASELASDSYVGLRRLGNDDEAAVSLGFMARVELQKGHRREASRMLMDANSILKWGANRTYELNNLIWLLKVISPSARFHLLPQSFRLIKQTGQRRRLIEVVLLAVGGNWLHGKAERYADRRKQSQS